MNAEGRVWRGGEVREKGVKPHADVDKLSERRDATEKSHTTWQARLAAKAREEPTMQFNNLMHHLRPELIEENLKKIPSNSAAGVDGLRPGVVKKNVDWLLEPVLTDIHKGTYKAPPVRRIHIAKADGSKRPLGIPGVLDRSIQASMTQILGAIYEEDFLDCSYGFRPGRGCHNALAAVNTIIGKRKMNYALEVDIRDFFGSLDHGWLRKFLGHRISDERVLKLIDAWLTAGYMQAGEWNAVETGTPQGGSISPLLANIYLHYVLDLWFEKRIKKTLKGKAHLVRYADDFIIFFEHRQEVDEMKALLKARFSQFGLSLSETKTHVAILPPWGTGRKADRHYMTFLGFNIFRERNLNERGCKTVYQTQKDRFTQSKAAMKAQLHRMMHWKLKSQVKRINSMLRGHFNYYGMAGNITRLQKFKYQVVMMWKRSLSRRSQTGRINWLQMQGILKAYPLCDPHLKIPYTKIKSYVL